MQEKLEYLLDKYSVETKVQLKDCDTAVIGGMECPLLAHRLERRFIEQKNIATGGTLQGVSVMRVARIVEKGDDIYKVLYRELDICQFVLQRKLCSIMAMRNDNVMNVITTTEDGVVCTIEISATLTAGEQPKDKHEIIAQRGTCCDLVVDTQIKQNSIYLFGAEKAAFTDVDFELYGLSVDEISVVRAAFTIAQKNTAEQMCAIDRNLQELVAGAKRSVQTGEREAV